MISIINEDFLSFLFAGKFNLLQHIRHNYEQGVRTKSESIASSFHNNQLSTQHTDWVPV